MNKKRGKSSCFSRGKNGNPGAFAADVVLPGSAKRGNANSQVLKRELASSQRELHRYIEQLRRSNEQLGASNEKLRTANEALLASHEEGRLTDARLRSKLDDLESITSDLTNFVASTDIPTLFLDAKLRVKQFTIAMSRLFGFLPSDVGRPVAHFAQHKLGTEVVADAKTVLETLSPLSKEVHCEGIWFIRRVLPYRTFDDRTEGVVITFIDITQIKCAETGLREREAKFRSLFENSSDAILLVDMEERKCIDCNRTMEALSGHPSEAIKAMGIGDLFPGEHKSAVLRAAEMVEKDCTPHGEAVILSAGGRRIPVEVSISTFSMGNKRYMTCVLRDISERKKVEAEHQQLLEENSSQREFLQTLIQKAPLGIAVVNGHDYRLELINTNWKKIPGVPDADMLGCSIKEILPSIGKSGRLDALETVSKTGQAASNHEFEISPGAGSDLTYWNIDSVPLQGALGAADRILLFALDVSEQVKTRKRLELEKMRYQAILSSMTDGLMIADPEGVIIEMNPAARLLHEFDSQDQMVRHLAKYSHFFTFYDMNDAVLPQELWPLSRALQGESFVGMQIKVHRIDTGKVWFGSYSGTPVRDSRGRLVMAIVSIRDITVEKMAELALRQSEQRFRLAVDNYPSIFVIYDAQCRISFINSGGAKLFGRPEAEIVGRADEEMNPPEVVRAYRPLLKKAVESKTAQTGEVELALPTGTSTFIINCIPSLDENGAISQVLCIAYEITERKAAEERLHAKAAELSAANNELEAFSYSVAHDLRNPLHSIIACSEVLVKDCAPAMEKEGREALDHIVQSSLRMSYIIADLMTLSRITRQEIHHETVDLSDIARTFFEELKTSDPQRTIEFAIEPGLNAYADAGLARILIENLIRNAWKFTSKRKSSCIEFRARANGDSMTYFIKDNGAGFDMAYIDRLFKPFRRLHPDKEFRGSGIGLAIVKRIVDKHGGTVWAEGEVDKGAAFYFRLSETAPHCHA